MSHYLAVYYAKQYSRSRSWLAEQAEAAGRFPMSRAIPVVCKATGCTRAEARRALERCWTGEWHHVGRYARKVAYYDTRAAIELVELERWYRKNMTKIEGEEQ